MFEDSFLNLFSQAPQPKGKKKTFFSLLCSTAKWQKMDVLPIIAFNPIF